MLDQAATETAFTTTAAAVRSERDVIVAAGPDAADYLHGQVSQDVLSLEVGRSTWTLLLQPQGKIDAWMRITRREDQEFWLDLDVGFGEAALARLQRFMLRVDATLELRTLEMISVRGPAVADAAPMAAPPGGVIADAQWPGTTGYDLIGTGLDLPEHVAEGADAALEALRIRLGVPAMGAELTESTIPAAAGIVERSVDFTKGCYVGQELVARIDSRGNNTPTRLHAVTFADAPSTAPSTPSELRRGDEVIGELTSYASVGAGAVGLAYIKRAVDTPTGAELATPGGTVAVEVAELPTD